MSDHHSTFSDLFEQLGVPGPVRALIIEHQLRPLFGFFSSYSLPTGIFAAHADFEGPALLSDAVEERIGRAVAELDYFLSRQGIAAAAAE